MSISYHSVVGSTEILEEVNSLYFEVTEDQPLVEFLEIYHRALALIHFFPVIGC